MSKEIAKSPEILEKEAIIKDLQSQLKKKKTALKSLKTRLKNTQQDITEVQRAGSGQIMSKMSQMEKLRLELIELVKKMMKIKGLSRADKAALKDMEASFSDEDMFGDDFKAFREQMDGAEDFDFEAQFGENERAKMRDIFETFAVKPNKEEQKDIRKVFISLSQKFHPDKAPTKADEAEYHEMMQKINEAYQAGDIHTLLELERLFLTENLDLSKVQSLSVDVLQQEIDRLQRDLQFIKSQIDRNSQELKSLRASDMGQMLTDMKRAEKEGVGLDAALGQLDDSIEKLQMTKEAFEECIKLGNTQPLEQMMMAETANQPSQAEMMAMLEDMMGGKVNPQDLEDMFGFEEEDEDDFGFGEEEEVKNAKFKVGSSVKIAKNYYDKLNGLALGNMIGRVESVYYDHKRVIIYEIELDSISLNKLNIEFVKDAIENNTDFQNFEIKEADLRKCQTRDKLTDTHGAYRRLLHKYTWYFLDEAAQKRLFSILLQAPAESDFDNWWMHFDKVLKFPIQAKSRGLMEFRKGEKMKIVGIEGINEEYGVIVNMNYRKSRGTYPLFDLMADGKETKAKQVLEDYFNYAQEMLEVFL